MDFISILLRLLLLLFLGSTSNAGSAPAVPVPPEGPTMRVDHIIETVDVMVLESFPMQLRLQLTGYQPDGCNFAVQVEQAREGNTIRVHIFRDVPEDVACPMMIVGYEDTIALEGSFEPGTYTIDVNGVITTIDL